MDKINKKDIENLVRMIEVVVHRKMTSPYDFEFLSDAISMRCHTTISVSTLKRIWGYVKNPHTPYANTLKILSRFIGYKDFDDFVANKDHKVPSSFVYTASFLSYKDMQIGDMVWIAWAPNRQCLLTYQGDHRFVVTAASNTKLHVGDSFSSMYFSEGMPLFLDNYVHKNNPPITFVVGYNGGLNSIKIVKSSGNEDDFTQLLGKPDQ